MENGLDPSDDNDAASLLEELATYSQKKEKENGRSSARIRSRRSTVPGTPEVELQDLPTLSEHYTLSSESLAKPYAPSFIKTPLGPNDPRALDFQSHIRLWFHDIPYDQ